MEAETEKVTLWAEIIEGVAELFVDVLGGD